MQYDVFISHASVDKDAVARPLAAALKARGLSVWLDEEQLQVGDSIRRGIDQALNQSRFGLVILSPAYLDSEWTRKELDALFTKEKHQNKTILPISHRLDRMAIENFSLMLADKINLSTDETIEVLANRIQKSIQGAAVEEEPHHDAEVAPARRWVWHCTDESLAKGQVSVLSVLETFWALGLYYLLAQHFQHHWWLLLTAFAAPIVLLRSEASVELGVRLLRRYWEREDEDLSQWEKIVIFVSSALVSFVLWHYWLVQDWLPNRQGWDLFWSSVEVGAIAGVVTVTVAVTVAGAGIGASIFGAAFIFAVILALEAAFIFAVILVFEAVLTGTVVAVVIGGLAIAIVAIVLKKDFIVLFFFPFVALGIWLRTLIIRVFATLRYPLAGLGNLPFNWQHISWNLDFTHLPELLPSATSVDSYLSVQGVLERLSDGEDKLLYSLLLPIWYIPSLLWRWSLKATLWLWWPLALLLKQPFSTDSLYQIRQSVVAIVSGGWTWLLLPVVVVIPWLLSGYYPDIGSLVDALPDQVNKPFGKLIAYAVPDPHSLRYAAIWLVCSLTLVVWVKASQLKSQFKMIIEDELYITDVENDPKYWQQNQDFYQRAESIAKWHTARIVSFILLGYSYILYLAYSWYPVTAGRFVPEWLVSYL